MSLEFEIAGHRYRAEKLDAFKQLHVSRKIAPIIPKLLPMFLKFSERGDAVKDDLAGMAEAFEPLAQALADMSDVDCEYVFSACLGVVSRNQQNNWASVWNGSLMFDDIDIGVMVQIASKVIWDSLGPFIQGLIANPAASPQPALNG
ncbi:MAG: phage tail assembly chaperone [Pseudomonadota bacterium]